MMYRYVSIALLWATSIILASHISTQPTSVQVQAQSANPPPANFSDELVTTVSQPTGLAWLPDGTMLITQQSGKLVLRSGTTNTTILDLGTQVCTNSERGLLSVAVDPAYASNHFIYVYYTFNKYNQASNQCNKGTSSVLAKDVPVNRVSRFTVVNNTVPLNTELVLMDNILSYAGNHNGGDLHFGKDGKLYISVGDGGCDYANDSGCAGANDAARDKHRPLGKILRINPDGSVPPDNPFYDPNPALRRCNDDGVAPVNQHCQETWVWGLRNPFRFATDPNAAGTRIFINDVGQNIWEEIDEGIAGADYGWNLREGRCANGSITDCSTPPAGMTNPIFDYKHGANPAPSPFQNCNSITGGTFIPNGVWPAEYNNAYFFSDYECGKIFMLKPAQAGGTASEFVANLGENSAVHLAFGPFNTSQALFYTTYAGGGQIRRIAYTGTLNRAPTAAFSATPDNGPSPLTVQFDASASDDPDVDPLIYDWNFGDGATQSTSTPVISHTYTGQANRSVTLTVRDDRGGVSAAVSRQIFVGNNAPTVSIDAPAPNKEFAVGEILTLKGSATDVEGPIPTTAMSWTVTLDHASHMHPFLTAGATNTLTFAGPAPEDLAAAANSYLEIQFAATDAAGQTVAITQELRPHKVNLTFATAPAGLQLLVQSSPIVGSTTLTSWEGYPLQVFAPTQTANGATWVFKQWNDGGPASRSITTPASPQTYTATFVKGYTLWVPLIRR